MTEVINRVGQRFHSLTVTKQVHGVKPTTWECLCDCGGKTTVIGGNLTSGNTTSCGCVKEYNHINGVCHKSHGMSGTPEHKTWTSLRQRCNNPNDDKYAIYGSRGIKVCDRWNESFSNFFSDMGYRPQGKSIDRIDNDGDYSPDNCKWSTAKEQASNTRNNRYITHNGVTKTVTDWSCSLGGNHGLVSGRIKRGWTVERAITTRARKT